MSLLLLFLSYLFFQIYGPPRHGNIITVQIQTIHQFINLQESFLLKDDVMTTSVRTPVFEISVSYSVKKNPFFFYKNLEELFTSVIILFKPSIPTSHRLIRRQCHLHLTKRENDSLLPRDG